MQRFLWYMIIAVKEKDPTDSKKSIIVDRHFAIIGISIEDAINECSKYGTYVRTLSESHVLNNGWNL